MGDRVQHSLGNQGLEAAGAARCDPPSAGCRPGRKTGDASGAIYVPIHQKPPWVLDADSAQGGDGLDHAALGRKRNAPPTLSRQITSWLKAGV